MHTWSIKCPLFRSMRCALFSSLDKFAPIPCVIIMTSVRSFMSIQYPRRTSLFAASRTNGLLGSTVRSGS